MVAGFTSCQKEELAKGTFTATMERFASKDGKMLLDGSDYSWEVNSDVIIVSRQEASSAFYGKGTYQATSVNSSNEATFAYCNVAGENDVTSGTLYTGKYYAHFPANILYAKTTSNHQVDLPSYQYTDASGRTRNVPMYAESPATSRNLQFKNLCGIVRLSLTKNNANVSRIVITTPDNRIAGKFNVTWPAEVPLSGYQTAEESNYSVLLTCTPSQSIEDGHDFDIALPAGTYTNMEIKIYDDDNGGVCTKNLYGSLQINRAQYTVIELNGDSENHELDFETTSALIDGELPGLFSVAAGRQVRFSQGNLQYKRCNSTDDDLTHATADGNTTGTHGQWKFAENQWEHISYPSNDLSSSYYSASSTQWVDLFRWGSSGYQNVYPDHLYPDVSSAPGTIEETNYDWGVFNAISNGGNEPGLWRVLTQSELNYLMNTRTNAASKWARVNVHGENGIVFQPDTWIGDAPSVSITWGTSSTFTTLSNEDWQALENAGAVFLPKTGRLGSGTSSTSYLYKIGQATRGHYWTATQYNANKSYYFGFYTTQFEINNQDKRYGCAVRLVRDVQ